MNKESENILEIDFSKLGGPVYIGRPKGIAARKKYQLDNIDKSNQQVAVIIPDDTFSINSSFFLGFFGDSVRAKGSKEAFLTQYKFKTQNNTIKEDIDDFVGRALREKKPLI